MSLTPHKEKIESAIENPKCPDSDKNLLKETLANYSVWVKQMEALKSKGNKKIEDLTKLLNDYKNEVEVELILKKATPFLQRQKGQLKLDNSIMEEFLIHLIDKDIIKNLPDFSLDIGPQTAFMSLSFMPQKIESLNGKPNVVIKEKDQDFALGKTIHYKFSSDENFEDIKTYKGKFCLAVLAAECKINFDKTMFQECAGTAARLKQGCPVSRYYSLVEFLDMQAEDCRLTEIDNVFLLRKAKRLPFGKRDVYAEVKAQHKNYPISAEVIKKFVNEIQNFFSSTWFDPDEALKRGSFI